MLHAMVALCLIIEDEEEQERLDGEAWDSEKWI